MGRCKLTNNNGDLTGAVGKNSGPMDIANYSDARQPIVPHISIEIKSIIRCFCLPQIS